jgi:membrane protein YqaA with SNARE-associated domain
MMKLTQAIVAVMCCTLAAGVTGGVVGFSIGTFAPSFVIWLEGFPQANAAFDPVEIGVGLGAVSGLFFGAAVGSFLVAVISFRDAWLARAGLLSESVKDKYRQDAVLADY